MAIVYREGAKNSTERQFSIFLLKIRIKQGEKVPYLKKLYNHNIGNRTIQSIYKAGN